MDIKKNSPTDKRPEGDRVLDDRVVPVNIPAFIEQLLREDSWQQNDRNAITLFKTTALTITLVALHGNAVIEPGSMEAAGLLSVQVLKGTVNVDTPGRTDELSTGQLIVIHERLEFLITAREEETLCLLTVMLP